MSRKRQPKKSSNPYKESQEKTYEKKIKFQLRAKTANQENLLRTIAENDITLAIGPPGSGKTYLATCYGMEKLLEGKYKRLIITRPAVEAGEELGFLPGKLEEKLNPYLQPIYGELCKYVTMQQLQTYLNNGKNKVGEDEIIIAPLAYMRGMNFHDSFMIMDEAQNATFEQIKMFITRVGFNSKCILSGDPRQSDKFIYDRRTGEQEVGLEKWIQIIGNVPGVGVAELSKSDIIRNPIITRILEAIGE